MMPGLEAVIGYAVGTMQVLAIDWWRRVTTHRRHLRLIQAELRRLRNFEAKFRWEDGLPPEDEQIPSPPIPTDLFTKTVGEVEWRLTDEHVDDNTQQSLLHLVDGCTTLRHYAGKVAEIADRAPLASPDERWLLRERGLAYADIYDSKVDELLYLVDDALRDIRRRLTLTGFFSQLDRVIDGVPQGEYPLPLQPNDPRLAEWRANESRRQANTR